ncbi:MAG: ATP-binding protein [Candidatus Aenigmatarchaeota archaeon]|nr:ATP-binding protein [Candidatus Aenigmarchaeota archaeon]
MGIEEIKSAIIEREEEMKRKFKEENIVKRENLNFVKDRIVRDVANIILGIRRCGKSIFAFQLSEDENFGYINFEDERLEIDAKELNKVLEALYSIKGNVDLLIFDEIQNIPGWERFVARILSTKKVIITGSNARLLSKELSTFLTGRHINYELFPFSFREYLTFNNIDFSKREFYITERIVKIKKLASDYLKKGGFPLVEKLGRIFIVENYKDIVERDVIQRFNIKNNRTFKEFSRFLVSNSSNEITYNSLRNFLKVSVRTISKWVDHLESAFLFFILERFSPKIKEQILAPKKIYCADNGIITSVSFRTSENFGKLMENLVAIELQRRKSYWFGKQEIFYFKDYQQNEVDFVLKEGLKIKQLIQVTYASSKDEIEKRELKALLKASKLLRCKNLLIITWDYEGEIKVENKKIVFKPLWKWLLNISL